MATALSAPVRSLLAPVLTAQGPFVTVYLATPSATENAAVMHETRTRDLRDQLADLGVDAATVDAAVGAVGRHDEGESRAIVAGGSQVLLAVSLPMAVTDVVTYGPLPHLLPLLEVLTQQVPHLVVLADRTGADLALFTAGYAGSQDADVEEKVKGTALDIRKVHPGGWAHDHWQNRADNGWDENAKLVASRITDLVGDRSVDLVVAAGDERAVTLIGQHLPQQVQPLWTVVPGGRGTGSDEGVPAHVADQIALTSASRVTAVLEKFAEEIGQDDRAVAGVGRTVRALQLRQVETLLLSDALDRDKRGFVGPDPSMIATTADEITSLGAEPVEVPLVDALVWSALGSDAQVLPVRPEHEHAPQAGVGAILRYHP